MAKEIACSLTKRNLKKRLKSLQLLKPYLLRFVDEGNALSLIFSKQTKAKVENFVALERACCSFAQFKTLLTAEEIHLHIESSAAGLAAIKLQLEQIGLASPFVLS